VELERISIWQNLQQTTKQQIDRLTCYPYVPRKSEIDRNTSGKIREKISPPLDPATTSADGQGPPVLGVHAHLQSHRIFVQLNNVSMAY